MIGTMLNASLPQIQGQSQREDRSHSPPFRASAKVRYVKSRLTGNAAAGNAYNVADMASLLEAVRNPGANNVVILGALSWQCARRTRATSSQWVASVNNISTLASRLN